MFHNVVVGKPIIDPWRLISSTKEEFENKIKNGELFEHEEIHENFYGMLNSSLEEVSTSSYHFIKDIGWSPSAYPR